MKETIILLFIFVVAVSNIIRFIAGPVFEVKPPDPLYPFGALERGTNAFSGTENSIPLGEGILNFCYADFDSAFERCAPALRKQT